MIRLIYSNGLKYPINNLSDRVFNTLKEKDKDKDKDKEEGGTGGKQPAKSQPESEQAVTDYCASLSLPRSDGEYFWNKWIGNGFRNNHEAMRDWKGVIRSWKAAGHCPSQNKKSAVAAKPWERNKPPDLNQEKRDREYEEHRRRQLERKLHEQK